MDRDELIARLSNFVDDPRYDIGMVRGVMRDARDYLAALESRPAPTEERAFRAGYDAGYDDGYGNGGAPKWHAATGVEKALARFATEGEPPKPTTPERAKALEEALRPMSSAPRDRTFILARYRVPADHSQSRFNGRWFSIFHEGETSSGYDMGWSLYPGYGGVPDDNFEGWVPCPDIALSASPPEVVEGET